MPREHCRLVVCADTAGRRKRPQRVGDRLWNGRLYDQKLREPDLRMWELVEHIEQATMAYDRLNRKIGDKGSDGQV